MTKTTHVTRYRDHSIGINAAFHFEVTGPGQDMVGTFDSLKLAKEKVDILIKEGERSKRVAAKLNLTVITDDGVPAKITGIHPRNRTLNGVGEASKVFPDVEWLVGMLSERLRLTQQIAAIDKTVQPYGMPVHVGYSFHNLHADDGYMEAIAYISREYKKLRTKAEKRRAP